MRRYLTFVFIFILFPSLCMASRGISLNIKTPGGGTERVSLYKESHALLVGVSDYTNGWPDLTSIPGEMEKLEQALKGQGFNVVKVINPDSKKLSASFENFINDYGFDPENRLLFFFSGHGYSRTEVGKGYIVPADAPSPLTDKRGFSRKAIEMDRIVTWARRIESKHAIFIFDSCFSGTVFQSRALPKQPPHISAMVARPIRQFISSGSAGEEVPAKSYFVPSFIRAIEGEGDLDKDGYITGTELGMYLNRKVSGYQVGQTPQYGKIRDPRLDQGDFVMVAGLTHVPEMPRAPQSFPKPVDVVSPSESIPIVVPSFPAGQISDYKKSAAFAQVMALLSPFKMRMMEHYMMEGRYPTSLQDLGLNPIDMKNSSYISNLTIGDKGKIYVQGNESIGLDTVIMIKPEQTLGGMGSEWKCLTNIKLRRLDYCQYDIRLDYPD